MKKCGLLCIALAISASATAQTRFPSVPIPPERILQNGYSLLPPNEMGWFIVGRNAYQLSLARSSNNQDESIAIQAIPFKLSAFKTREEFIHLVQEGQAKDTDPKRFTILNNEITSFPMQGTECVKSYMVTEDHAAVKRSRQSGDMILEARILTCAHPSDKNVGISIIYSHRHYPEQGDSAFMEKAEKVLNSVEFVEPNPPYFPELQKLDVESPSGRFSTLCSKVLEATSTLSPIMVTSSQPQKKEEKETNPLQALASLGISIGRNANTEGKGSYAIFEKNPNGEFSLISVKPYYIPPNSKNQEVLFITQALDIIAPAFAAYNDSNKRQAFVCGTGAQGLTNINSSGRRFYNPCDSSLTTAVLGPSIVANTLLTIASLGTNLVTGSTASFVDTNKEKVAELAINSKLLECLNEANLTDIKAQASKIASTPIDPKTPGIVLENDSEAPTVNCVVNGERVWTKPSKCDP